MISPAHSSATELLRQLASGETTSEALVRHYLKQRDERNPALNAIVTTRDQEVLEEARKADAARARGEPLGPLHGLPMTLKDTWETAGVRTTAGSRLYEHHLPTRHADAVQRLVDAGALIMGKTNVPVLGADIQTWNPIFGLTRNPWNTHHTSGGSSGGAAAALAAGLTPLELGSDIGGSIRTPAHFCGIYGHKSTRDIISLRGHVPGAPGAMIQPDLVEAGPLATCADDLELMLRVIAGPRAIDTPHWQLALPPPKHPTLEDLRIGVWWDDPACPIDPTLHARYEKLATELTAAGAIIVRPRHPLLRLSRLLPIYFNLLGSIIGFGMSRPEKFALWLLSFVMPLLGPKKVTTGMTEFARAVNQPFTRWLYHAELRERLRFEALDLFSQIDVLLTPVTPTAAIPHDQTMPMSKRRIRVGTEGRPYADQFAWIALATALGLPATVAPVGRVESGLPFGIQIIGNFGQDLATIHVARLLAQIAPPPRPD